MLTIPFKKLEHGIDLPLPQLGSPLSAGLDITAAIKEDTILKPGERALIPCGFSVALPEGFEMQIRPRSGLAYKHGVTVLNSPGTVDADYRGEIKVLLINHGHEAFTIERGMRIAQIVIAQHETIEWTLVANLDEEGDRGGGFGSTGLKAPLSSK